MDLSWLHDQALVQRGVYILSFFAVGIWELEAPLQEAPVGRWRRWSANGVLFLSTALLMLLMGRLGVLATAEAAGSRGWGLAGAQWLPVGAAIVVWMLTADLLSFFVHRLLHRVPALWRLHKVHHSDAGFDLTTQLRFHPLEAAVTLGSQAGLAWVLAPPAAAVLLFEAFRSASGFFTHANASFPPRWERWVSRILITPDLHRVHHATDAADHDTNFGVVFSIWDGLAGTFRARSGPVSTGLAEVTPPDSARPMRLLLLPFLRTPRA